MFTQMVKRITRSRIAPSGRMKKSIRDVD